MPRATLILIVVAILLVSGAIYLSRQAREVPTHKVEVDVTRDAGAH